MPIKAELKGIDANMNAEADTYRGYSAYEIAVQHGFEGTESDWLASLHASAGTVNGKSQDEQGNILLYAIDILMNGDPAAVSIASKITAILNEVALKADASEMSTELGKKAVTAYYTATLTASGWSSAKPYMQEISIAGIQSSDTPIVDVSMENATTSNYEALAESWTAVNRIATSNGKITAYCYEDKPTVDLKILLKVVR